MMASQHSNETKIHDQSQHATRCEERRLSNRSSVATSERFKETNSLQAAYCRSLNKLNKLNKFEYNLSPRIIEIAAEVAIQPK